MLEFINLAKETGDEISEQLETAEADVERLRTGEVTPDMIAAGLKVLRGSGAIEQPIGADEVLVADIYRAMVQADPAT
jgi:hypothetical protein